MTPEQEWVEIVAPMPALDARHAYTQWKAAHPSLEPSSDDDIRVDLIHTTSGDLVRYLIRSKP